MKTLCLSLGLILSAPAWAGELCAKKGDPCAKASQHCVRGQCQRAEYLSKEATQALADLFKVALSSSSVEAASLFR